MLKQIEKDMMEALKNQEKELRFKLEQVEQSKFFLKEIAKIAKVGGWIMNTQTDELNWTEEIYNIHGLPIGDKPPLDEALDFYRDGAREIVSQTIQDSVTYKRKFDYQLPFQNLQKEKQQKTMEFKQLQETIIELRSKIENDTGR